MILRPFFLAPLVLKFVAGTATQNLRRELQGQGQGNGQGQANGQATVQCIPYLVMGSTTEEGGGDDEEWVCETSAEDEESGTSLVYKLEGLDREFFEDSNIESGDNVIKIRGATRAKGNKQGPPLITLPPRANVEVTRRGSPHASGGRRHLAPLTGDSTALVVRVTAQDIDVKRNNAVYTREQISSDCFTDTVNMVTQFDACSGGKYRVFPASNDAAHDVVDGVVEITVPFDITDVNRYTVENYAREELATKFGFSSTADSTLPWDLVMFVWSSAADWEGAAAYAYVNGKRSAFQDNYIWRAAVQLHEIGHNMQLYHSGQGAATYTDHTVGW